MKRIAALLLVLSSTSALADETSNQGLGLRIGTAGAAVDYTHGLNRYLDLRAGYHFGSYRSDQEQDDIEYRTKTKISSAVAMLDVKPFAGSFRISLGAFASSPEMRLKSAGRDNYQVGARTYTADLVFDGDVDLGGAAPYLGIGWGGTSNAPGWGASLDLGVMFTDSPDVSMDVSGRACDATALPCNPNGPTGFDVNGNSAEAQQFQRDKEQEIRNIEEDLEDYRYWPVAMLGLHYRF